MDLQQGLAGEDPLAFLITMSRFSAVPTSCQSSSSIADARARERLNLRGAAEVIEVPVRDQDELDVPRIEASLRDVVDHVIDVGLLGRVDENEPVTGRDEPDRHEPGADVIQVVEDLDGRDLLVFDVVALAPAVAFAQRLFRSRSAWPWTSTRQQERHRSARTGQRTR